jgi:hypothetical protein
MAAHNARSSLPLTDLPILRLEKEHEGKFVAFQYQFSVIIDIELISNILLIIG